MTLIALKPGVAAHLAIQVRRSIRAFEDAPNLAPAGQVELDDLLRVVADLDKVAGDNCGQDVDFLVVVDDNGVGSVSFGEAASMARVHLRTLVRRLADGELQSTGNGMIEIGSLKRWIHDGKPTARQRRRRLDRQAS